MGNNTCSCIESEEVNRNIELPLGNADNDNIGLSLQSNVALYAEAKDMQDFEKADLGTIVLEGGVKYTGQWKGGVREGEGTLERPDGGRYEGQFKADKAHGSGKLSHVNGDAYEGEWFEDRAQGYGKFLHQDGSSYEGQWHRDMQQGIGCEIWSDGSKFEGSYWGSKKTR